MKLEIKSRRGYEGAPVAAVVRGCRGVSVPMQSIRPRIARLCAASAGHFNDGGRSPACASARVWCRHCCARRLPAAAPPAGGSTSLVRYKCGLLCGQSSALLASQTTQLDLMMMMRMGSLRVPLFASAASRETPCCCH